ncbi:MAG: hypothetical protein H6671_05280 [Anaerolineaceae bacterium]|nr:hypothetical protein [Anaerolineaceae bacterium]
MYPSENVTNPTNHIGRALLWISLILITLVVSALVLFVVVNGLPGGSSDGLLLEQATETPNYPLTATALIEQATANPQGAPTLSSGDATVSLLDMERTATAEAAAAFTAQSAPGSCAWQSSVSGANPALLGRLQAVDMAGVTVVEEYPCGRTGAGLPVVTALHITLRVDSVTDEAALGGKLETLLAALVNDPYTPQDTLNLVFSDGRTQVVYWGVPVINLLAAYQDGQRGAALLAAANTSQR